MLPLPDLQAAMTKYLTSPPGPEVPKALRDSLPPGMPHAEKRFTIYKNNVYARLVDALRDTFPAVERLVGEEFFRAAAVEYIARTPPGAGGLTTYGQALPDFLAAFPPAAAIPYLADVARLEICYLEAYHAADAVTEDAASVAGSDGRNRSALHPSARLLTSSFQISRIWELNRNEASFDNVALPALQEYLLVIRPRRQVEVRRISLGAYAALLVFESGGTVAEARDEAHWADPQYDFEQGFASLSASRAFVKPIRKVQPA